MNPKQQRFCEEYAVSGNGARSAIHAGYAPTHAKVTASRMLTYANVTERVAQLIAEGRERLNIDLDSLTEMLVDDRKLAHDNKQAGAAVSATEKIAKIHGYMKERIAVDVNVAYSEMSDAELAAERERFDREYVIDFGREGIEERIAAWKHLLVRFDNGEFDDILPPDLARVPKAPPVLVLPPSEFQSAPSEQ